VLYPIQVGDSATIRGVPSFDKLRMTMLTCFVPSFDKLRMTLLARFVPSFDKLRMTVMGCG